VRFHPDRLPGCVKCIVPGDVELGDFTETDLAALLAGEPIERETPNSGHIHVRRTYKGRGRVGDPKNHERRTVDLSADTVQMLGRWWGESAKPAASTLVFPYLGGAYIPEPKTLFESALRGDGDGGDPARRADRGETDRP
jgi:hypothetical protein